MYADSVDSAWVDRMFCDLDAIELLTLAAMFKRAEERVYRLELLGTLNRNTAVEMEMELSALHHKAFRSCVKRCASISSATEFYMQLPAVEEWREEKLYGAPSRRPLQPAINARRCTE